MPNPRLIPKNLQHKNLRIKEATLLDLSAVVAGIKGSRWHPQITHLLALALCCVPYFPH
jgi:hypothetical protein